jgi:hypothetical protein
MKLKSVIKNDLNMVRIEKELINFQTHKKLNRLTWVFLSLVEELYNHGSNFSEEKLEEIRKIVREETDFAKIDLESFLSDLEKTEIKLK